jgi:hypothetical protein
VVTFLISAPPPTLVVFDPGTGVCDFAWDGGIGVGRLLVALDTGAGGGGVVVVADVLFCPFQNIGFPR